MSQEGCGGNPVSQSWQGRLETSRVQGRGRGASPLPRSPSSPASGCHRQAPSSFSQNNGSSWKLGRFPWDAGFFVPEPRLGPALSGDAEASASSACKEKPGLGFPHPPPFPLSALSLSHCSWRKERLQDCFLVESRKDRGADWEKRGRPPEPTAFTGLPARP